MLECSVGKNGTHCGCWHAGFKCCKCANGDNSVWCTEKYESMVTEYMTGITQPLCEHHLNDIRGQASNVE